MLSRSLQSRTNKHYKGQKKPLDDSTTNEAALAKRKQEIAKAVEQAKLIRELVSFSLAYTANTQTEEEQEGEYSPEEGNSPVASRHEKASATEAESSSTEAELPSAPSSSSTLTPSLTASAAAYNPHAETTQGNEAVMQYSHVINSTNQSQHHAAANAAPATQQEDELDDGDYVVLAHYQYYEDTPPVTKGTNSSTTTISGEKASSSGIALATVGEVLNSQHVDYTA